MTVANVRLLGTALLVLLLATAGLVWAQEAEEYESTVAEEGERAVAVGEIVVTAKKRTQNLQDVPVSVSALSGEDLQALTVGTPDIRILSARVPSLVLESSFGRIFPRFYIRGLGNSDFDLNASQPVSMVVDEVVLENPIVKSMPLWDLERIEVLRGPQGTLFGRNTPAGIVKLETRKPTRDFDANFRLSYGTYNTVDISGGVGGPLSDTLAARVSVLHQSRSDWIDNDWTGEKDALEGYETNAYRLQLLWQPSDELSALLNLHGWEVDGTARVFRANFIQQGEDNITPGSRADHVYHDGFNSQDVESYGGVFKLDYDFGAATLTAVTGFETVELYTRGDIDGGYGAVWAPPSGPGVIAFSSETADGLPDHEQLTQELRLTSTDNDALQWLVGAFYFKEELQVDTFSYDSLAPGHPLNGYSVQYQDAKAWALFGSIDYEVNDQWSLGAGLRISNDEKDFSAERPFPTFANTVTVAPITEHTDDNFTSWDLSATYKVNHDFNIYSRLATSFRAPSIQGRILFCEDPDGGANPATNCVSFADTEEIISFETGIKTILADGRLRLNLTGYIYEIDGQQVTAVGGQYNTATLLNIGETEGFGFEADIEFIPSGNWLTTFGISYNPTEINDPDLAVAPCGGGCTVTDPIGPNGAMVHGNSLPHAPDWIINGIINYRSAPVDKAFFGTLDWSYYSEKQFFVYESEEFKGDGFEVGLRLGYAWDNYEVALYGRNVTDELIVRGGIDFNNLTAYINDPRIIGIELVARF